MLHVYLKNEFQGDAQGDVIAGRISLPGMRPGKPKQRQDADKDMLKNLRGK